MRLLAGALLAFFVLGAGVVLADEEEAEQPNLTAEDYQNELDSIKERVAELEKRGPANERDRRNGRPTFLFDPEVGRTRRRALRSGVLTSRLPRSLISAALESRVTILT